MTQAIVIQNGLVSLEERTVSYQIPLAEWMDKIEKRVPLATPVLPVGTRALFWDITDLANQKLVVLIEQEPQIIRMNFLGTVHELSIPFTRFFFYASTNDPRNNLAWHLEDYRVFWAKSQYRDPAKIDMIPALMPNVYPDGRICFGSTGANADQNLADRLQQTVNEFWVSQFNRDLTIRRPNNARTWRTWERQTQRDPTAWLNWDDFDENVGRHRMQSFDMLTSAATLTPLNAQRQEFMIAAEPIPTVPLGATFGRLNEWLDTLDNDMRNRLFITMNNDRNHSPDRYEPALEADDEDEA